MAETEKPDMVTGEELEKLRTRNLELEKFDFERVKLQADSIKHITTLATGTVVILATFMDKIQKPVIALLSLEIAVGCMLTCLVSSFVYLWALTILAPHRARLRPGYVGLGLLGRKKNATLVETTLISVVYFSFPLGIGELGKFVLKNMNHLK